MKEDTRKKKRALAKEDDADTAAEEQKGFFSSRLSIVLIAIVGLAFVVYALISLSGINSQIRERTEELNEINNRKTGALLVAACQMGVAAAGGNEKMLDAAGRYAAAVGAAFQIRDDMLDVLSTEAELGKPIGSDAQERKNTFMALYGEEKCRAMIGRLTQAAKDALNAVFADTAFLRELADSLADRKS